CDRLRANGNKTIRAEALSGVEGSQYVGAMLSLDYPDGPQPRDALGDAGQLHRLDDVGDVFIGVRHLLGHRGAPLIARDDAAALHLLIDVDRLALLLRLRAAHEPAGAVAGAAEGLLHRRLGADQEIRIARHVAG